MKPKHFVELSEEGARRARMCGESGWTGYFTRRQASGAYPNGTQIMKCNSEKEDHHSDGTLGIVLGSLYHLDYGYCYFIEWEPSPHVAVAIAEKKIKRP